MHGEDLPDAGEPQVAVELGRRSEQAAFDAPVLLDVVGRMPADHPVAEELDVLAHCLPGGLHGEHVVPAALGYPSGEPAQRQHGVGGQDAPGYVGQRTARRGGDAGPVRPLPLAAAARVLPSSTSFV